MDAADILAPTQFTPLHCIYILTVFTAAFPPFSSLMMSYVCGSSVQYYIVDVLIYKMEIV